MLDMDVTLIQRLHRHRIHPIVLLVRFKSVKQIREVSQWQSAAAEIPTGTA